MDLTWDSWMADLIANLVVSLVTFAVGFVIGKRRERSRLRGRNLEQYDFYPFAVDSAGFSSFDLATFRRGVRALLEHGDATAAAQLIVIGEQNGVRYDLDGDALAHYEKLYTRFHGHDVMRDSSEFLENYRRIVRCLGRTFRDMGIEVLLHDLVNPSRSITTIVGGEVTGRSEGMGSTNLVIDLKRRFLLNQDNLWGGRCDLHQHRYELCS